MSVAAMILKLTPSMMILLLRAKGLCFQVLSFCHPGVMKFASEKGDEFVRKHIHPHIEPYKKREAKA